MLFILQLLILVGLVAANTETQLIKIPRHYDIPPHPENFTSNSLPLKLNESTYVFNDFFIARNRKSALNSPSSQIEVPYNVTYNTVKSSHTVLVRLNNYLDDTYNSDDTIYAKLCWPATLPFSVSLSHRYIEREMESDVANQLVTYADLYLQIDYYTDVYPVQKEYLEDLSLFKFNLHISRHGVLPIPYEIVDLIMYIGDIAIIVSTVGVGLLRDFIDM